MVTAKCIVCCDVGKIQLNGAWEPCYAVGCEARVEVTREAQRDLTPRDHDKIRRADPSYIPPERATDIEAFKAEAAYKRGDPDNDTAMHMAREVLRRSISKHSASAVVPRHELTMVLDYLDALDGVDHED